MRVGTGTTYSDVTAPLRRLTSHGTHFRWTKQEQSSFDKLKELLMADTVLMNYEKDRPTRLYVDHGPKGVAATVAQGYKVEGQRQLQWRAVHHSSRALTKAELNYQKIEGESLAVYSGIKSNQRYLLGTEFEAIMDHEPLAPLYNNPTRPAPTRVDRHRSKLGQFMFTLKYEPGRTSPCDYASRHPPPLKEYSVVEREELGVEDEAEEGEIWIRRMVEAQVPTAVTLEEIKQAIKKEPMLVLLTQDLKTGRMSKEVGGTEFKKVFGELTHTQGLLLRGDRLVMPKDLQARVIAAAHEGHQGEEKTLRYLRERVWFPGMTEMCKEFVQTCHPGCTSSQPKNSPAPMVPRDTPAKPWQVCATDYKGPIGGPRGYYFHVLIDLYSKWPEIAVTKSTKFEKLLPVLDSSFCTHGVPEEIIHDNGPPYTSYAWKE